MATFPEKTIYSFSLESANAYYTCPESIEELQEIIDYARNNGFKICPAGGLQSFSKVCLISKQIALDLTSFNRILFFDPDARQIIVEGGIKVLDVLSKTLPYGLILKSLTGSTNNTIAGNVSSDVNGKDSWKNGNFGANILSMKVLLSDGRLVLTSPSQKSDLFYSVVGGLGSIGIVVEVTLGLQRVPSTTLLARSQKVDILENCWM
jgi:FAD/FMN-containing dehydrogenase